VVRVTLSVQMGTDKRHTRDDAFREFVITVRGRLTHVAELLTGDHGRAEDLVQGALVKTYLAWGRLADGDPEAFARRTMVNANIDWWRRRTWVERPTALLPERPSPDQYTRSDNRATILASLNTLTARERKVVVLRYYVGLTEAETARELGIALGTVKSAHARAITKLRHTGLVEGSGSHD
jgi:RNA polymerase sigma-70 factor (sigma-E family)